MSLTIIKKFLTKVKMVFVMWDDLNFYLDSCEQNEE